MKPRFPEMAPTLLTLFNQGLFTGLLYQLFCWDNPSALCYRNQRTYQIL